MDPLVATAMKKAAVAWLSVDGHPPYLVWCRWLDGALYVVSGPGEQSAPGLAGATRAVVTGRGDHGGRIVAWPAAVTAVAPGTAQWAAAVPALAARRLNSAPAAELTARWAGSCRVSRLAPIEAPPA